MAIQKTEAIVLKATKFRETSLITTFFSADFGKIKTLSKGIRKEHSPLASHYEPFNHVQLVFYEKTKSDIHFLSESSLLYYFSIIRRRFEKIVWASFLCELVELVLPLEEKNPALFRLFLETLHAMEDQAPLHLVSIFEVKLILASGLFPRLDGCMKCGRRDQETILSLGEGGILCESCRPRFTEEEAENFLPVSRELMETIRFFAANDFSSSVQLKVEKEIEKKLHQIIYRWVRYRFEKDLATMRFLSEVQSAHST